jgi:glyoxylase-like metal-dependent hydrolase (beta-lactamase superfamily II)
MNEVLNEQSIGPLTVLFGRENGKYPQGNSLLVKGKNKTVMIDPSLGMVDRKANLPGVDMVLLTHVHEDHVAGLHLFPNAECFAHTEDAQGLESLAGMMEIFGYEGPSVPAFEASLITDYYYQSRPDVQTFVHGDQFDLGGVRISVIHTPGHTRGHSCFEIEWDGSNEHLVVLGDIDLTSFGPYYGDGWSSLVDFECSLDLLKEVDAHWWLTFHHKGLVEGRSQFLVMLDKYQEMINYRETNLLNFISEPKSLAEIAAHQFIYRPGTGGVMVDQIERRSMAMHLERLLVSGHVMQQQDNCWRAIS